MFSELVDRAVHTAGRPDHVEDFAYFANEIMRDVSKRSDWDDDTIEEEIVIPIGENSVVWQPEVGRSRFRREEYLCDACGCEPLRVRPSGRMKKTSGPFYYRSGGDFVFAQACSPVKIFYYAYQPWLKYYPKNERPAEFDVEANDWPLGTAEATVALVSNWMLERHNQTVLAGTLARFFSAKQDPRQQVHYSSYEQGIKHLVSGESARELIARR